MTEERLVGGHVQHLLECEGKDGVFKVGDYCDVFDCDRFERLGL